jgi:transcriptional regulator with GAF, ATPase, and Fis domain
MANRRIVNRHRGLGGARAADKCGAGVQRRVDRLKAGARLRVVGESAERRDVLRKATQVATADTTVLITGESGTGKEVVGAVHPCRVRAEDRAVRRGNTTKAARRLELSRTQFHLRVRKYGLERAATV